MRYESTALRRASHDESARIVLTVCKRRWKGVACRV